MIGPLEFFAPGIPAPKGSTSSFRSASTGRIVTRGDCKRTGPWQAVVASVAALTFRGEPWTGAVAVHLRFVLPRPKGHFRRNGALKPDAPRWPTAKPDGDKLERCVWDALVRSRVLRDDAIVVSWSGRKVYEDRNWVDSRECGVFVKVERLT